ncbi:MAG: FAD:protein FMN transferase [Bacteroidales bacterium]|nr:FAD:protein FMN transferase [Bacteroidales bacterium]
MKKIFFLSLILITLFNSCLRSKYINITGLTQGTTFSIKYKPELDTVPVKEIYNILNKVNSTVSLYDSNSILCKINKNITNIELNDYFIEIFRTAYKNYQITEGTFDPTVAPILKHYKFIPGNNIDTLSLNSMKNYIGFDKVKIIKNKVIKPANIQLDFNGIAQGFTVDKLAMLLESYNIKNYLIEIGGEVKVKGLNEKGEKWKIGIDKPIENSDETNREIYDILELTDCAISTSGVYRQFKIINGEKHSHIINPHTGKGVYGKLLSATVITSSCADADAIATAVIVMGLNKAKQFFFENPQYKAYLIYEDENGKIKHWKTENLK